jgi:hypothetical protein
VRHPRGARTVTGAARCRHVTTSRPSSRASRREVATVASSSSSTHRRERCRRAADRLGGCIHCARPRPTASMREQYRDGGGFATDENGAAMALAVRLAHERTHQGSAERADALPSVRPHRFEPKPGRSGPHPSVRDPSQDWQCRNRAPSLETRHSRLCHPSCRRELSLTPPAKTRSSRTAAPSSNASRAAS